ncbi:hypothetical protein HRI_003638500 [Hibiscus trionum]|uniref:Transmembrane protein n=1 Tax=Hibiscus trionum TaxID=183268 RepID=A0A9W7MDD0_HIBTR|nr:hypothetical protein HRI_003638500 [Hibiscus trionum]
MKYCIIIPTLSTTLPPISRGKNTKLPAISNSGKIFNQKQRAIPKISRQLHASANQRLPVHAAQYPTGQAGPPFMHQNTPQPHIYKPLSFLLLQGTKKMGNSNRSSLKFLIVLAIALFLLGGSQFHARPFSPAGFSGFRAKSTLESSFRDIGTMLPKGQPVPPSGPDPGINV